MNTTTDFEPGMDTDLYDWKEYREGWDEANDEAYEKWMDADLLAAHLIDAREDASYMEHRNEEEYRYQSGKADAYETALACRFPFYEIPEYA